MGGYAVSNSNGILKYYDGALEGKISLTIDGTVAELEDEYNIKYYRNGDSEQFPVSSGREVAVLEKIMVAKVESSGEEYTSFAMALENTEDTDKITILDNIKLIEGTETLEIVEGKNLKIDLAGFKIDIDNELFMTNNGTLEIFDSSTSKTGNITNTNKIF